MGEREPIERVRARLEALVRANAAPRCGARSKRTGKPCRGAAMPNGRCKVHGGKSTGPRTPEGLERSRRANWKHGHFSREAKAERSRVRAAILTLRYLRARSKAPAVSRSDTDPHRTIYLTGTDANGIIADGVPFVSANSSIPRRYDQRWSAAATQFSRLRCERSSAHSAINRGLIAKP